MEGLVVERFVVGNLDRLFPGMTLVAAGEVISGRFEVDLHLRDGDMGDVFVEIRLGKVGVRDVGNILNYYMLLSNEFDDFRFIVLAEEVDGEAVGLLEDFGVEVLLFSDLSITDEGIREFRLDELVNVLTPTEAEVLSHIKGKDCGLIDVGGIGEGFDLERGYASKILDRLEKKEYLERIKPGIYLFIPMGYGYDERYPPMNSLVVGSVLTQHYYYGYQTANRYHGFTSRFSPVKYICTPKSRRDFTWRGITYRFVRLVEEKFFGFYRALADGCEIFVAEPEKAVLDSLDKPGYCGGLPRAVEALRNAYNRGLRGDLLLEYSLGMGSNTVIQRLGYLTEFLVQRREIEIGETFLRSIEKRLPREVSNTFLGSVVKHGRRGSLNLRWRVIENVGEKELSHELEVR
jgi:predicted transcriptional regulator of viral defense system